MASTGRFTERAAKAIVGVAEGFCPLCRVQLVVSDGRACCPCAGYRLDGQRFEMTTCAQHLAFRCEHWLKVWSRSS